MQEKQNDRQKNNTPPHFPLSTQLFVILTYLCIFPIQGLTAGDPIIIKSINERLEKTSDPKSKSKLYIYRARYYQKENNSEKALDDYGQAITLNHQSWIHLERAALLYSIKEYEKSWQEAQAAKNENPGLSDQADAIASKAYEHLRRIEEQNNPQEIVMDRETNPYRSSRFDLPWSGPVKVRRG